MRGLKFLFEALMIMCVRCYQWCISPFIPARCRYLPTCSEYAVEAISEHGACTGGRLALQRLARCHPFGGHGLDPVPPRTKENCVKNHPNPLVRKRSHAESEPTQQPTKPE